MPATINVSRLTIKVHVKTSNTVQNKFRVSYLPHNVSYYQECQVIIPRNGRYISLAGTWTTPCLHFIRGWEYKVSLHSAITIFALRDWVVKLVDTSPWLCFSWQGDGDQQAFPAVVFVLSDLHAVSQATPFSLAEKGWVLVTLKPCNELSLCTAETCPDQSDPRSWSVQLRHSVF